VSAHVVVVGGGITGLAAAHRLLATGREVTLVEPDTLGGKLRTSVFAGRAFDEGADAFLLRVPWALALCDELQMAGELTSPAARSAYVWSRGELRPLPAHQVLGVPTDLDSLAASGVVSPEGIARARLDLEAAADERHPAVTGTDVALGPYLRSRLGDEVFERLVDPLVGGINAGDSDRLSLAAVVPQLDAAARSGDPSLIRSCAEQRRRAGTDPAAPVFAAPFGGMARLVDGLLMALPALELRAGRRVTAVEPLAPGRSGTAGGSGWRVALDDGSSLDADAVVVTTPAFAAADLVRPLDTVAADLLAGIGYASVALVAMACPEAAVGRSLDGSGFLVPRVEGLTLTACSWATSKWAHLRAPGDDTVLLRASVGRAGDRRALDLDDDDLVAEIIDDLARTMDLRGAPTAVRVNRWERSFPQYAPGHLERVAEVERRLAAAAPGVVLAGAAYRGLGVPACIHQAEEAVAGLGEGPHAASSPAVDDGGARSRSGRGIWRRASVP
jgi:oxygen-dependent protoporphyrinogen oxidase